MGASRRPRPKVQVVLVELRGSETWYLIRHQEGAFRVPGDTQIAEVFKGSVEGWTGNRSRAKQSERRYRVSWEDYKLIEAFKVCPDPPSGPARRPDDLYGDRLS